MATRKYSVPFETRTLDIYEVNASSPADAAMKATEARLANVAPTHSRVTKFAIGSVKPTLDTVDEP